MWLSCRCTGIYLVDVQVIVYSVDHEQSCGNSWGLYIWLLEMWWIIANLVALEHLLALGRFGGTRDIWWLLKIWWHLKIWCLLEIWLSFGRFGVSWRFGWHLGDLGALGDCIDHWEWGGFKTCGGLLPLDDVLCTSWPWRCDNSGKSQLKTCDSSGMSAWLVEGEVALERRCVSGSHAVHCEKKTKDRISL